MYEQLKKVLKLCVINDQQSKFTALTSPCSEKSIVTQSSLLSHSLLLTSSLTPSTLQSYLHLSILICPSFKQPPFSAAEIEQPPIVCLTKQHFSVPLGCDLAHNRGDLALLGGCCVFCSILCLTSLLWCFVGFRSAAMGSISPVAPTINTLISS